MITTRLYGAPSRPSRIPASEISTTHKSVQTKLSIGKANDSYEREADRVADAVVSSPSATAPLSIQRMCADCEKEEKVMKKGKKEEEEKDQFVAGSIQRKAKEDEKLQMKQSNDGGKSTASSWVSSTINQSESSGHQLPKNEKAMMESRFGADFSHVKIHTGTTADQLNTQLGAQAFTVGNHIYFGDGKYNPATSAGQHLLAHELTHTIQQKGMVHTKIQRSCSRTIFAEGDCEHLACNSSWACEDENGISCPDDTRNAFKKTGKKYKPLFTCDRNCDSGKSCSDTDNWAAVPKTQWSAWGCGTEFTVCANGKQAKAYVRDKSVTDTRYEVSPGIQTTLGVPVGSSFLGAVYRNGADQSVIDKDTCCKS